MVATHDGARQHNFRGQGWKFCASPAILNFVKLSGGGKENDRRGGNNFIRHVCHIVFRICGLFGDEEW
jgi:hypothetical protein